MKRDGAAAALQKASARLRKAVYSRKMVSIIVMDVADFRPRYRRRRQFCDVVLVSRADLDRYTGAFLEHWRPELEQWLAEGDRCFLAVKGQEVVGLADLMFHAFQDQEGLRLEVGEGECKVREIIVAPAFRHTPVIVLLHEATLQYAREIGLRRVVGAISFWSDRPIGGERALRNATHAGYRETRRLKCTRLFSRFAWAREVWRAE
jgi:GNAT superfamily N-acetyltransferase